MIYTENYQLRKPVIGVDDADVNDLNYNSDRIDVIMHSSQISLADAYDLNSTYNTGDVVMYEFLMYRCLEDNVTGVWNPEKWTRTTAGEESGGGADLDIYGEASGTAEASFSDGAEASLVECEIGIVPTQDLHGYSKPWAGGAGKNKLPNTGSTTVTPQGITFTVNSDGSVTANGTATATATFRMVTTADVYKLSAGSYIISGGKSANRAIGFKTIDGSTQYNNSGDTSFTLSEETTWDYIFIRIASGEVLDNETFYPMIRTSGDATYEPYSNICPISGHTDVTVTVASTSGGSGEDTTVSLGRTVYGGTLDVTTGELTVNKGYKLYTGDASESWSFSTDFVYINISDALRPQSSIGIQSNIIVTATGRDAYTGFINQYGNLIIYVPSSITSATDWKTWLSSNNLQIVYDLATPQTFNLTPTQVETLLGQNYVSHDGGGTISLVYIKKDSTIIPNPSDAEVPLTGLEISGKDFVITDARIPAPPTTNGAYVLTVTVTGGTPTYSWENA